MGNRRLLGWLIGYFVFFAPHYLATDFGIIGALIHSIIGVTGAIFFWEVKD